MLALAITTHAAGLILGLLLASWLPPALLAWLFGRRRRVSVRDALIAPGTLILAAIVFVVLVTLVASDT